MVYLPKAVHFIFLEKFMSRSFKAGPICFALLLASVGAQAASFTLFGAGQLARSTSADGRYTVGTDQATGHYFMWDQNTGIKDIGGKAAGNGIGGSPAISANGGRVIGSAYNANSGKYEMSFRDNATGQWTHLGGLGGDSGAVGESSSGWAVSGNGQYVAGAAYVPGTQAGRYHAAVWNQAVGTMNDLGGSGITGPNNSTRANAISDDGRTVVGWSLGRTATVWKDANGDGNYVRSLITDDSGVSPGEASDVSGDGKWVVGVGNGNNGRSAWIWSAATGVQNIAHMVASNNSSATAVSEDGSFVVGFEAPLGGLGLSRTGYIWTQAGGTQNFDSFLAGLGIDVDNTFNFSTPLGISADGKTIVGFGYRPGDVSAYGFSVNIATAVPEAASLWMMLGGLGGLSLLRRSHRRVASEA